LIKGMADWQRKEAGRAVSGMWGRRNVSLLLGKENTI